MEAPLLGEIGDAERAVLRGSANRPGWYSKHGDLLPHYNTGNSTFIDKDLEKLYKRWCRSAASRRLALWDLLGGTLALAAYYIATKIEDSNMSHLDVKLLLLARICGGVSIFLAASFLICGCAADFQVLQYLASLTAFIGTILFPVLVVPSTWPVATAFILILLSVIWIRHWFFLAPRGLGIYTALMLLLSSAALTIALGLVSGTFGAVSVVILVLLELLALMPAALILKAWVNMDRLNFFISSRMNAEGVDITGPEFAWYRMAMDKSFFNTEATASPDDKLQEALSDKPFQPVFVCGFQRTGTTFTYASLTQALPQAGSLGVMDVLEYPQLLKVHQENLLSKERSAFNLMMEKLGQSTRVIDRQPARDWAVEEHGFILNKFFKVAMTNDESKGMFEAICRKLLKTQERTSDVVLMKNPQDYGKEDKILKMFPRAKFIHIRRDPVFAIDSMQNAFRSKCLPSPLVDPYGMFLYTIQMVVFFAFFEFLVLLRGPDKALKFLLGGMVEELLKQTDEALAAFPTLPDESKYEIHYEELIKDPSMHVRKICEFIGLPPNETFLQTLKSDPRPRKPAAVTEEFRPKLERTEDTTKKRSWWMYMIKPTSE